MDCALAADTKIETPEGALTVKSLAGKTVAVFTRDANGRVRFRAIQNARKVAEQQPVVRITLDNGISFRIGCEQLLYKRGMTEVRAQALVSGDALEPAFYFPEGYRFHDDQQQAQRESHRAWHVVKVEAAGEADLYSFAVRQTGTFFLTAGVLAKAEGN